MLHIKLKNVEKFLGFRNMATNINDQLSLIEAKLTMGGKIEKN